MYIGLQVSIDSNHCSELRMQVIKRMLPEADPIKIELSLYLSAHDC